MRWLLIMLLALFALLTAYGQFVILPERDADRGMIHAYWEMADHPQVAPLIVEYRAHYRSRFETDWEEMSDLLAAEQELHTASGERAVELRPMVERLRSEEATFRDWYNSTQPQRLDEIPRLVWATDANPARRLQCQLFREWHLEHYGTPVDIVTDASTRGKTKTTKMIIQCIAGTGPDIIESYGPAQLRQFVDSGIAIDITEEADAKNYGLDRIFPAAHSSLALDGRQYGFTCNVGYVVLLYHKDLFAQAGIPEPTGTWTIDELIKIGKKLEDRMPGRRRYALLGLHPWPMALADGGMFFNETGTVSFYNSPQTVRAFRAFQDLIYTHHLMPSPAETDSMSAAGGFGESNVRLFIRKAAAMTIGGRWDYATLAQYNRDRAIIPTIDRELAVEGIDDVRRTALERIRASLRVDVLKPLTDADDALMRSILTDADNERLLHIGVAHVPNVLGPPTYEAAGRVALVNRASPHVEYAKHFIEFLASEAYNEQINESFDSICGMPEFCLDDDGIAGPPKALPGLEDLDSQVFVDVMLTYAQPWELSPFVGRQRYGELVGKVMEQLQNETLSPAETARLCEDRINDQIRQNLIRDDALRARWEALTGIAFDPEIPLRAHFTSQHGEPR
ncbi:MAG: extracellular solute-binding protein [Phycisphaerales bacterium]|nr:extracellular solute-binding protein [Phycisphaerales bacterium]